MVFNTFTFLLAGPVHEKAIRRMRRGAGDDHDRRDAERGHTTKDAEDQRERAGKFGENREKSEQRRDLHRPGEKVHGAGEAVAAEPAEQLLRAMRKHDKSESKARQKWRSAVVGFSEECDEFHIFGWVEIGGSFVCG